MPSIITSAEILNTVYGRLTIIKDLGKVGYRRMVEVKCLCGVVKTVSFNGLRMGHTKSCGCYNSELCSIRMKTHGLSKHPLFTIWAGMKERCHRIDHKQYADYGGRGIYVCDEWKNDFSVFYKWCISNGWVKGLTIDRINNDGIYSPENCRIATNKTQQRNKRSNVLYTINGETKCLGEWCEYFGLSRKKYKVVHQRINRDGLTVEQAIFLN